MTTQLDFFIEKKSELDYIRDDVKTVRESNDKIRKSLFARHGELARKYMDLHDRLQIIEKNICSNKTSMLFQS